MSQGSDIPGGHRPYHHGDLPGALVRASFGVLASQGIRGFSVAEVARRLGVSSAAPYRHFADRDHLLAEVAVRAAIELRAAITAAVVSAGADAEDRFAGASAAYVRWTVGSGAGFQVIFAPGLPDPQGNLARAGEDLLGLLLGLAHDAGARGSHEAADLVGAQIALAHGYAEVFRCRSGAQAAHTVEDAASRAERATRLLVRGITAADPR